MRMTVGMIGITLMGMGMGTAAFGLVNGLCLGVTLLGLGLIIDAIKR